MFLDFTESSQAIKNWKKKCAPTTGSDLAGLGPRSCCDTHLLSALNAVFTLAEPRIGMESPVATTDPAAHTFSQVLFADIPPSYLPATPITCCYTLTPALQPQPRDWVGIFKVRCSRVGDLTPPPPKPPYACLFCFHRSGGTQRRITTRLCG